MRYHDEAVAISTWLLMPCRLNIHVCIHVHVHVYMYAIFVMLQKIDVIQSLMTANLGLGRYRSSRIQGAFLRTPKRRTTKRRSATPH